MSQPADEELGEIYDATFFAGQVDASMTAVDKVRAIIKERDSALKLVEAREIDLKAAWAMERQHVARLDESKELLSAACSALGSIMSALGARRLLARGIGNATMRAKFEAEQKTDEEIEKIAADAFEAAALALAKAGYPGASVHSCNPTEEP